MPRICHQAGQLFWAYKRDKLLVLFKSIQKLRYVIFNQLREPTLIPTGSSFELTAIYKRRERKQCDDQWSSGSFEAAAASIPILIAQTIHAAYSCTISRSSSLRRI